jgi:opacity protein-like surface antigen
MKKIILASACILALASPAGAHDHQAIWMARRAKATLDPGASQGAMKEGAGTINQGTTGASSRPSPGGDASTSGANTAVGVNNAGMATQPGAVKDGVNKR